MIFIIIGSAQDCNISSFYFSLAKVRPGRSNPAPTYHNAIIQALGLSSGYQIQGHIHTEMMDPDGSERVAVKLLFDIHFTSLHICINDVS